MKAKQSIDIRAGQQQLSYSSSAELVSMSSVATAYAAYVLDMTEGNITRAAKILGVGRRTLVRMIRQYDLQASQPVAPLTHL